ERLLHEELQRVLRGQKATSVVAQFSAPMGQQRSVKGNVGAPLEDMLPGVSKGNVGAPLVGVVPDVRASTARLDKRKEDRLQWEDYLIGLLLQNPALSHHVCGIINDGDFAGADTRELYH